MSLWWRPIKIGGGGWLVGIDISVDGTKVAKSDVYGAFLWANGWKQLVTVNSMPAGDVDLNKGFGVYDIRVAPGRSTRLYMVYNGYVYRSENKGATWTRTAFPRAADSDANGKYRYFGRKMAIDPANSAVVLVGTPSQGVWITRDAGESWSHVTALGTATAAGYTIAFDPSSPVVNGCSQRLYVCRYGKGVYRSTNGGASWTLLSGSPTTFGHMTVGLDGAVYLTPYNSTNYLYIFSGGAWRRVVVGTDPSHFAFAVAVDPANANHIAIVADNGALSLSTDHGVTWSGLKSWTCRSDDVPWLAATSQWYMSTGDIAFDPSGRNLLYLSAGTGVWKTSPGTATTVWTSQTAGIENLVANTVVAPPGGKPVIGCWDFGAIRIEDPESYAPRQNSTTPTSIVHGWSLDYAAALPTFMAGIFNNWGIEQSGYSTNGGLTWTQFLSKPAHVTDGSNKVGGSIAVSSPSNMLWFPSQNCPGYFTVDGGKTWKETTMPGVSNSISTDTGWGSNSVYKRQIVAADRVTAGTFYAFNYLKGVFRTRDGGVTWTLMNSGSPLPASKYNAKLRAMPGSPGTLFFTSGMSSTETLAKPSNAPLMVSRDGGATWRQVNGVTNVYDIGFGAPPAGSSIPAIYMIGFSEGQYGIYASLDNAASWSTKGQWPIDLLDTPTCISGDMARFGYIYVGFSGSGFSYRII